MSDISLILLAAGSSSRFGLPTKKQWLRTGHEPLWLFVAKRLSSMCDAAKIIVVGEESEIGPMRCHSDEFCFVVGGKERQESLSNALKEVDTKFVMSADVARCCVDAAVVSRLLEQKDNFSCVVPYLPIADTVLQNETPIAREELKAIQTPQLSVADSLRRALAGGRLFTDDSTAIASVGESVGYVQGSPEQLKLTVAADLARVGCLKLPAFERFSGIGFDAHRFEDGRTMKLGGVEIECGYGFLAHSDGDVLAHAVIDAILGAAGCGDIGTLFPDSDQAYKNADSMMLLKRTVDFVRSVGFDLVHIDASVIAEQPRLEKYKESMRRTIAKTVGLGAHAVNIKATTTEKMGFVGRKEGVAVQAIATLKYYDWTAS